MSSRISISDQLNEILGKSEHNIHNVMNMLNQGGKPSDLTPFIETVATSHLVKACSDIHRLQFEKLSKERTATETLNFKSVTFAGIGMSRDDIASPRAYELDEGSRSKTFTANATSERCGFKINHNASNEMTYDQKNWQDERTSLLKAALESGANIISLGEFDFPWDYNDASKRKTENFEKHLTKLINNVPQPVFLIAGSRHDFIGPGKLTNTARIFVNNKLLTAPGIAGTPQPILHHKRTAAFKMGEKLSPPENVSFKCYDTSLGNIGVLICSDAYDPNLVFEFFRNSDLGLPKRVNYIIVPAYNTSPKLFMVCQTLSLLTKTVVMLVDACAVNNNIDSSGVSLFISGKKFKDIKSKDSSIGTKRRVKLNNLQVWTLNNNSLIQDAKDSNEITPFYEKVQDFLKPSGARRK
jgi:predicted amidohydrolase